MSKKKWVLAAALSLAVFLLVSYTAAWLLLPPREGYGSTWESYLLEDENSIDILCFGSSLVYCNIVPGVIYEESGITTYLMAGPEQTIPITYSYVKEACRTQQPKVVAIEVTSMFYPRYCNYSKVNVSYMPWSLNRLEATFNAAEPELRAGLLFPIFDYHSRWSEVSLADIKSHLSPEADSMAGYTFLEAISPQSRITQQDYTAGTENYLRNLDYLQRIHGYCMENGIQLMLFISPAKGVIPDAALSQLKDDISELSGAVFVNFNDNIELLAIDDSTDWYDFLHFNCRGAEKFSRRFADYLTTELHMHPTEGEDDRIWLERSKDFAAKLEAILNADSVSA